MSNPLDDFEIDRAQIILDHDGKLPLIYWPVAPNFGDLLSPWLFNKITGLPVSTVKNRVRSKFFNFPYLSRANREPNYVGIGSIISRVKDRSIVWGTGSFGTEQRSQLNTRADYHAVRGPLTRSLLQNAGIKVPEVYGDPALLVPYFFRPTSEKKHEIGLVLRWSERQWMQAINSDEIKVIDLGTNEIEKTLDEIASCKKIITSSLHGLIIADAFGIPNAWLASNTPKGGEFKFIDYFSSVDKHRRPITRDLSEGTVSLTSLEKDFEFDDRSLTFDPTELLKACPLLKMKT